MDENYYDILEVNKNASPEMIEKAYKLLVKKYHPDLQENNLKIEYEEKIKKINEAYEVLSNQEKRKNYDLTLNNITISSDDYNNLINENINLKNEINYLKFNLNKIQNNNHMNINSDDYYFNKNINLYENTNKKIYDKANNITNTNNTNLNTNYITENLIKNSIALFITVIIITIIGFILWHIPFIKNYLLNLYYKNSLLQYIINIFIKIFN